LEKLFIGMSEKLVLCLTSSSTLGKKGPCALNTAFTSVTLQSSKESKALGKSAVLETLAAQLCHCIYEHARQLTIAESGELSTAMFCATRSVEVAANFNLCQSLVFFYLICCTLCCVLNCVPSGDRRCVHLIALHMYTHLELHTGN
jgi:hypothetical protein